MGPDKMDFTVNITPVTKDHAHHLCAQSIIPAFIQKQCQIYGIAAITVEEKSPSRLTV